MHGFSPLMIYLVSYSFHLTEKCEATVDLLGLKGGYETSEGLYESFVHVKF